MKRNLLSVVVAILGLALCQAESALAATFKVSPIQVFLSAEKRSELLTLTNESDRQLRFQISARAWTQATDGSIELAETADLVFFPMLLTLEAGEERNVRVGLTTELGEIEKTYRIFFEELPSLEPSEDEGAVVRVLTKMGIPIFATPPRASSKPQLEKLSLDRGVLRFEVVNAGNEHMMLRSARVIVESTSGEVLLDQQAEGWYVLPGTPRRFEMELAQEVCASAAKITVRAATDAEGAPGGLVLESSLLPEVGDCASAPLDR